MSAMAPNGVTHDMPFLRRNWVSGLNQARGLTPCEDHPAKKRRRLSPDSPRVNGCLKPYGGADLCLPEEPGTLQKALSIEVLRIFHRDTSRVKYDKVFNGSAVPYAITSRARCKVTIQSHEDGDKQIIFCDSQVCEVKTYKNPVGPSYMARIHLPRPFIVPHEKILVARSDDCVFDLADSYTLHLEIEGAGDPKWPPPNLLGLDEDELFPGMPDSSRFFVLAATIDDIFPRSRSLLGVTLRHRDWDVEQPTDFTMDADIRWTTGFSDRLVKRRLEKGFGQSITFIDPDEDLISVNGKLSGLLNGDRLPNGHHAGDACTTNGHALNGNGHSHANGDADDYDDEGDGDTTPRKSLRARGTSKVYNLKLLSDKAHGKERKRPRMFDSRDDKGVDESCTVLYTLPTEHVAIQGLVCGVCGVHTHSVNELRAHFLCHPRYDFHLENRLGKGAYTVDVSISTDASTPMRPRVYQLGLPTKLLDLDRYIDGDDSWVTSRYGPENDMPVIERNLAPVSSSRAEAKPVISRVISKPVVPNVKNRLFDPLSKAELVPGADVPKVVCDDAWLIQKHRDHLQDFVDIGPSEKEYMKEWDAFNFKNRMSSEAYIKRAFVSFVAAKASWLVGSESRMVEFGKHLAVLTARGVINEAAIEEARVLITEAKNHRKVTSGGSMGSEPVPNPVQAAVNRRSSAGCGVCGKPVKGPQLLVCASKVCGRRVYHKKCARPTAKMSVESVHWRCNECAARS
ncbi:hypothetical protein MAPG_00699 [Magnaporthiopsis poae ATCC 64411]|uniref:Zinc finger PHD-type domain-containing protein n=1 Tax=Magnaporthiopsis poae (strain ATCC 64411 / 73-15) TaxID=644358 RepID=A0A0C4DLQ4_MAGP6|nr:hypothetical protein MAPG_00699 [Magnaporthiopsis poae ATCC 64411]